MSLLPLRLRQSIVITGRSQALLFSRAFASSSKLYSATPDWQELIGGRAGAERKRILYEDKYKKAVEDKAKREGVTVEEMRRKVELTLANASQAKRDEIAAKVESAMAAAEIKEPGSTKKAAATSAAKASKQSTPIKPLEDILDLSKASTLTPTAISSLWTTYHQSKGFLSAAIPTETYSRMLKVAQKYPIFVLPLARDIIGDLPEGVEEGAKGAVEMHFLEWAFLPPPPNVAEPIPAPSTVLFTPLAEYKQRAAFAQPYLILTHYSDLAHSHGVVLMRGEISDNVALNAVDAQVLAVRLQLFYNPSGAGGEVERKRSAMLAAFHEKPEEFDLNKLVSTAWEL